MNKSIEYLEGLYQEYGDFKLWFSRRKGKKIQKCWKSWKNYSKCSPEEKAEANLFEIPDAMVIFDVEENSGLKQTFQVIGQYQFSYEIYNSREGYHIHSIFLELDSCNDKFTKQERLKIKEWLINKAGSDPSKKNGLISVPFKGHFKNGRIKLLIKKVDRGLNVLPKEILELIKKDRKNIIPKKIKKSSSLSHINYVVEKDKRYCKLMGYCLKNRLKPNNERGKVLAPNFAVLLKHTKPRKEAIEIMDNFFQTQNIPRSSWLSHIYEKNTSLSTDFRCGQLRNWLRKYDPFLEQSLCQSCKEVSNA